MKMTPDLRDPGAFKSGDDVEPIAAPAADRLRSMLQRSVVLLCILAGGCMSSIKGEELEPALRSSGLIAVWIERQHPPDTVATPDGFNISPRTAFDLVMEAKRLSLKHRWACYRDDRQYYVFDTFGRSTSAKNAQRHGVRIDGRTGAIAEVGSGE